MKSATGVICLLAVILLTAYIGSEATSLTTVTISPIQCVIDGQTILSSGKTMKDPGDDCRLIICNEHGAVEYQDCGPQKVHGCKDYIDKSLPFPDCCARHIIC